jgi:hypothetical protein
MITHAAEKRVPRLHLSHMRLIFLLVPMFLIISSSVYPAIMSGIQSKELKLISDAVAELQDKNSRGDSSGYHANIPVSEMSSSSPSATPTTSAPTSIVSTDSTSKSDSNDKKFSTQAALQIPRTLQSNDLVNSLAFYEVTFITSTTGAIDKIEMEFPAGTNIAAAGVIERVGIGGGTLLKSGSSITYDVTTPVSIPAGTFIRLEIFGIKNPNNPSTTFTATITTRDSGGNLIDGPSQTNVYTVKQIGTNDIADNSITDAKLSLDSVYTVWRDSTPGNEEILYKRNTISFDPDIDLSNTAGSSSGPAVAASGNNVYVVWSDFTPGNFEILYRRSTDGGATFGSTINLSNNGGSSSEPAVAVSGNNVYVVWRDSTLGNTEILYRRSTDAGATFGGTINLSNTAGSSSEPAVAVSGNNVYVVWRDSTPGNDEILYRRSTDGGATFRITTNLSTNAGSSSQPAVAASGNNVYVVWTDNTPGNAEILYRRSTDGGATFGSTINLSNNAGTSFEPAVAASGNNVYVVWNDDTPGNFEILYRRSTDGGATFGSTINLSNNAGGSFEPAVAASGNNVYVVWRDSTPGNDEILYRRSTDGGATFGSTINLSNNAGISVHPAVAAVRNLM